MTRKQVFFTITISLLVLFFIPKPTLAEITTVRDWIGLFTPGTSGSQGCTNCDSKSGTINGNSWVYTNTCSKATPGPTALPVPNRMGNPNPPPCTFTVSPAPAAGPYEFRMYANNEETPDALISTEPVIFGNVPNPSIPPSTTDRVYYINSGDLTINNNITADKTGVIFVDSDTGGTTGGNLNINTNLINNNQKTGLVFVVKGDVRIDKTVTQIDAVIIAQGTIYTATDRTGPPITTTCATNAITTASALTINGSLISLDENHPPMFCRNLGATNFSSAAEKIIQQPKYLVILRNLYSDTSQEWSEIK